MQSDEVPVLVSASARGAHDGAHPREGFNCLIFFFFFACLIPVAKPPDGSFVERLY